MTIYDDFLSQLGNSRHVLHVAIKPIVGKHDVIHKTGSTVSGGHIVQAVSKSPRALVAPEIFLQEYTVQ